MTDFKLRAGMRGFALQKLDDFVGYLPGVFVPHIKPMIGGLLVEREAIGKQPPHFLQAAAGGQLRTPVARGHVSLNSLEQAIGGGVQPKDGKICQPAAICFTQNDAATQRQHGLRSLDQFREDFAFEPAKPGLAPLGENPLDRHSRAKLQHVVRIDGFPTEPICKATSDGRLSCPSKADQCDSQYFGP
jgi:hypothetical protein